MKQWSNMKACRTDGRAVRRALRFTAGDTTRPEFCLVSQATFPELLSERITRDANFEEQSVDNIRNCGFDLLHDTKTITQV
ncbi:hypothetical protein E2C01_073372 [Portunus trituberculatus]|uniref:Uncharacterized protein n=1 Tax=Portunus trituberculatus TaxID=210409 RepID=A0A5B7I2N3_PORTR|nr:hypothetical protein [Portunus trituberculatus]